MLFCAIGSEVHGAGGAVTRLRVAVVTGAARGIGAATVLALVREGWGVLAVDCCTDDPALSYRLATREQLAETLGAARSAAGGQERVAGMIADVRDVEALTNAVADAEGRWGRLDAAIACAGVIAGGAPHRDTSPEAEQAVLDVDLGGVLNLARAAVPALLRCPVPREGRFLAVASSAASRGLPNLAAYCAAKAGVLGFVRALAVELAGTGVTANAVSPGSTDTAMLAESARLYGLTGAAEFAQQQPLGRLLAVEEIAAALLFLAGTQSSAMTGAVVPVDGGLSL